jgi:putative membrane protein insertion efficiency factor
MDRLFSFLLRLPRLLLIGVVRAYQLLLSPHLGSTCRFVPTCSEYAIQAFREYGAVRGLILTVYRLGRCHPWGDHGYDPPRWFGEQAPAGRSHASDGASEE